MQNYDKNEHNQIDQRQHFCQRGGFWRAAEKKNRRLAQATVNFTQNMSKESLTKNQDAAELVIVLHCGRTNGAIMMPPLDLVNFINQLKTEPELCKEVIAAITSKLSSISEEWLSETALALHAQQVWYEIKESVDCALDPRDKNISPPERYERARLQADFPEGLITIDHLPTEFPCLNARNELTDRLMAII